ncbi:Uncharacterised protein [Legionella wadsworthii]|uniref:Uncharacterized protein n=1 Tax=Legionella wadsworthii TaxID=28088 RepID=A0A378LQV3_9GAMM|nr:hypothetical protein [Legionella wadsworthii]STY29296.1 Uncharacterised protein [Legionella wadsworthii]
MSENKQEQTIPTPTPSSMIYFQNLVPGKNDSELVANFRAECLDSEDNETMKMQRNALLLEFPPILSFLSEEQKKKFYEQQQMNCLKFCCGSLSPITASTVNDIAFSSNDEYVFSPGNGQLYEGSQKTIQSQIKDGINQEQFGSPAQKDLMEGLSTFDKAVNQRIQSSAPTEEDTASLTVMKSPTPFDMEPKK